MMSEERLTIAVIGAGIAGIAAAHVLQRRHEVTLYERNDYVGGHTNTIVIDEGPDAGAAVDTGFIVLNDRTYPTFNRFLAQLGVSIRDSDMSFSYYCPESGLHYASSSLNALFAQRGNLLRPRFLGMIRDILRFNRRATSDLEAGSGFSDATLGEYIARNRWGDAFRDHYLLPMAAAIWSTGPTKMLDFPAEYIAHFYKNHGLLTIWDQPRWKTVIGGSHTYVKAFLEQFKGTIRVSSPVQNVSRDSDGVEIVLGNGETERFDRVVLAAHANESLSMLADPSNEELAALGAWSYEPNHVVLHCDPTLMPPSRRAWASWNYVREGGTEDGVDQVSLTYYMNGLQGLNTKREYFVSVNRKHPIADADVIARIDYTHPVYTFHAMKSQAALRQLSGSNNTYFCGSYFGYGFHEDATKSGVDVARAFGMDL